LSRKESHNLCDIPTGMTAKRQTPENQGTKQSRTQPKQNVDNRMAVTANNHASNGPPPSVAPCLASIRGKDHKRGDAAKTRTENKHQCKRVKLGKSHGLHPQEANNPSGQDQDHASTSYTSWEGHACQGPSHRMQLQSILSQPYANHTVH